MSKMNMANMLNVLTICSPKLLIIFFTEQQLLQVKKRAKHNCKRKNNLVSAEFKL